MRGMARLPQVLTALGAGAFIGTLISDRLHGRAEAPPVVMPRELTSYRDLVKRVLPAVVSIETRSNRPPARLSGVDSPRGIPEELRRFFEGFDENDPRADPNPGFGSGFLIDARGVVLTNFHVVDGADAVEVLLQDGRKFTSTEIRRDPSTDLAVIVLAVDKPVPFLELGDSDAMEVGDRVLAIGAPYGLTGSVTHGIVSAKSRQNLRLNQYEDFIQTDAAMNPGNSGGPLINLEGRVIGINAAIKTRGGGSNGVGLAVSSNLARDVSRQLLTNGVVRRGFLGVGVREIEAELADRLGVAPGSGVLITSVYENAPAFQAGLRPGDVLLSIAGTPIRDVATLPRIVAKLPLNQVVEIQYSREGKVHSVKSQIVEQPQGLSKERVPVPSSPRDPRSREFEIAGVALADLTPELALQMGYARGTRGVLVTRVDRNSAAFEAGLTRGAMIIKVDRFAVQSVREFQQALTRVDPARGALLQLMRPNGELDFVILRVN